MDKDAHFYSIEINPEYAEISRQIIKKAGLENICTVIVGNSIDVLQSINETHLKGKKIDLLFLDHWKKFYLRDIMFVEKLDLLQSSSVVVADNVIFPGTPEYLNYIRNNSNFTSTFYDSHLEYDPSIFDGVEISIKN